MRARLLLAGAVAAALVAAVVVVFVAAAPEESAMPSEPLRRSPAPAPAEMPVAPPVPTGDTRAGAEVFAAAGCGNCHTLLAAGATGTIAPALDGRTPSYERFLAQVTEGGFGMPAYRGQLTETEIEDVVAFVFDAIAPPRSPRHPKLVTPLFCASRLWMVAGSGCCGQQGGGADPPGAAGWSVRGVVCGLCGSS